MSDSNEDQSEGDNSPPSARAYQGHNLNLTATPPTSTSLLTHPQLINEQPLETVTSPSPSTSQSMPRQQHFRRTSYFPTLGMTSPSPSSGTQASASVSMAGQALPSAPPPPIPVRQLAGTAPLQPMPAPSTTPAPPIRKDSLAVARNQANMEATGSTGTCTSSETSSTLDPGQNPTLSSSICSFEKDMILGRHTHFIEFYKSGRLCDVVIECGQKMIPCHKMVLSSVSSYFDVMFTSDMAESRQSKITIKDIDESAFEALIDFAYTFTISLTTDNVQQILYAASILQMEVVAQACSQFMHDHLHPSNVVDVYHFAEQHGRAELTKMANMFILEHFYEVSQTEEFKSLLLGHLTEIIQSDDLNVVDECQVVESVMKWVKFDVDKRKANLAKILSHVKLPLLPMEYLLEHVETEALLKRDWDCRDLLDEAKNYHLSVASLVPSIKITERLRPRKSYAGVIFCVGGRGATGDPFRSIEVYDICKNRWFHISEMMTKRRHVAVIAANGKLYSLGGHDGSEHLRTCEVFDPKINKWTSFAPMETKRRGLAAANLNGPLYVVGGLDDEKCYNKVERYDPDSDTWTFVASMSMPRGGVGVAAFKGMLYAVGGNDGMSSLDTCERYCPHTDKWTLIANMHHRRAGAGVASLHDYLYVLGGFDDNSPLNSVERYCPRTNTWTEVSKMSCSRGGVGVASLAGLIFAVGGHDGTNYLNSVEAYDPVKDSWQTLASTMKCRAGAGVNSSNCLLSDLQEGQGHSSSFSVSDCV